MEKEITEEEYENEANRSLELGIISGMKRAANLLLKKATSLWERDREKEADLIKNIYREVDKEAKELRIKYDEKHKEHLYGEYKIFSQH